MNCSSFLFSDSVKFHRDCSVSSYQFLLLKSFDPLAMAPTTISWTRPHNTTPQDLTTVLISAMLEWVLIFLLFIDATFSYVIKTFAHVCKLQPPCLLCSRLDHVFGKEKRWYYWDLICGNHKSEISSLVLCHTHNKLVDVRGMCETCLFSFATINKSNAETYRLLVGKLGYAADSDFDQDPLLECHESHFPSKRYCSCCNEPFVSRRHAQKLIRTKLIGLETAEVDVPLPGSIEHYQKDVEKGSNRSLDPLSHIGYAKLKISSDTESEATTSDDDNTRCRICKTDSMKEELSAPLVEPRSINLVDDTSDDDSTRCMICEIDLMKEELSAPLVEPHIINLVDDSASEKHIDPLDTYENGVESGSSIGHGLEELNWHQVGSRADASTLTEPHLDCVAPSPNAVEVPQEITNDSYITSIDEVGQMYSAECREDYKGGKSTSEICLETNSLMHDARQQTSNILDIGDAYKLAVGDRGKELSTRLTENWIRKDSSSFSEDFKLLLSEVSANQGIEQSANDVSPKFSVNSDDLKISDSCNSFVNQILQKRISLERNESGLSLDGSIVSEIEGESVVDSLKRQVEHDRKLMAALYKELEEERNASSVAANQAMAMITRLQEEKAALHMEALQYLRMMEEQAEYDDETLQKSNDLLTEKEKEVQNLEAELEFYRNELPNKPLLDDDLEKPSCEMKNRDIGMGHSESCEVPNTENDDRSDVKNSLLEFEDEKIFILQCLKNLENELHFLPSGEVNSSFSKVDFLENRNDEIAKPSTDNVKEDYPESCGTDEKDDVSLSGWNSHAERDNVFGNSQLHGNAISETCCSRKSCDECWQVTDIEFLSLNKRLEALESDLKFLEHTIHSLRNGDKGFEFIQEITSHLLELRKLSINRMKL